MICFFDCRYGLFDEDQCMKDMINEGLQEGDEVDGLDIAEEWLFDIELGFCNPLFCTLNFVKFICFLVPSFCNPVIQRNLSRVYIDRSFLFQI